MDRFGKPDLYFRINQPSLGETMLTGRIALLLLLLLSARVAFAEDPAEELLAAARKGDVAAVKGLLDKGVDVNSKNRYGATALSFASDRGNLELVTLLIERGADVNATDTFYKATPITWATMNGHADVVKLLLDKGAKGVDSVLMQAVGSKDAAMVKVALDKGGIPPATVKAGPKYELMATNPMGEVLMATPAISDGLIFVRGQHPVFAIAESAPANPITKN